MEDMKPMRKRVLAVASGGGHWVQLLRLRPAFEGCQIVYISTNAGYQADVQGVLHVVMDANMWQKMKLIKMFMQVAWIVISYRPDIIITTGAAPGFSAIMFGKLLGAKTIWLDSIANSEELSTSGQKVKRFADVWLTQWPHLADEHGPKCWGSVL